MVQVGAPEPPALADPPGEPQQGDGRVDLGPMLEGEGTPRGS